MAEYKYHLQAYTSLRDSRHECPKCHDKHSFTYYVDERGDKIDELCGRCNHECGCGYHYSPSDYFRDHPDGRPNNRVYSPIYYKQMQTVNQIKPMGTISNNAVSQLFDRDLSSDLAKWILRYYDKESVGKVWQMYAIGRMPNDGRTIFWQVDKDLKVRTGKILQYDPDTGHRLHTGNKNLIDGIEANWYHAILKRHGKIPEDWNLCQCLFGEHLLRHLDKSRPVAVVEGEKTAVIATLFKPDVVWLACGGLRNFNEEKMRVLTGRNVILFPDNGCVETWTEVKRKLSFYAKSCRIEDLFVGDNDPSHEGWDIADIIIDEISK